MENEDIRKFIKTCRELKDTLNAEGVLALLENTLEQLEEEKRLEEEAQDGQDTRPSN